MKRVLFFCFIFFQLCGLCFAEQGISEKHELKVYSEDNLFGLQTLNGENITNAQYQKLIRVGENGIFLVQKRGKFGLINSDGQLVVPIKNSEAERVFAKYVKLKNFRGWGLYDDNGENIIPQQYSSIDPLFGKMFLTKRNYKYGIVNYEGKKLLNNDFEDIYMPNPHTLRIKYNGEWYEIVKHEGENFELDDNSEEFDINNSHFTITKVLETSAAASGYSLITTTDYTMKLISSISPAYEETIDELMLSKGAEVVSIFTKFSWLPKFPFVYAKNYYNNVRNPFNGPLYKIKSKLKQKM